MQPAQNKEQPENSLKQKGNQLYKEGHYGLAAALYRKYLSKPHSDNKNAYYNLALCCFKMQRYQECVDACKQALTIDPDYLKVYFRLALAFQKMGQKFFYRSYLNAEEYCYRNKDMRNSAEWIQMKQLRQRVHSNMLYTPSLPIEQRNKLFYPNYKLETRKYEQEQEHDDQLETNTKQKQKSNLDQRLRQKQKQQQKQKQKLKENQSDKNRQKMSKANYNKVNKETGIEYFGGYSWRDVEEKIKQQNLKQALDIAYSISRKSTEKDRAHNKQNVQKVKLIMKGAIPSDTKLEPFLDKKQQQKNISSKTQSKKGQADPTIIHELGFRLKPKGEDKQVQGKSDGQILYEKHFKLALQRKIDAFEGFPNVVISVIRNQSLSWNEKRDILQKARQQHEMFMVLQMSMSNSQKEEIKRELGKWQGEGTEKLIASYCI